MTGMNRLLLDCIEMELGAPDDLLTLYINVYDSNLSRKWLAALNELIKDRYHLEKNYCFFGFDQGPRTAEYICDQINESIQAINSANLGYTINDHFTVANTINSGAIGDRLPEIGRAHV